MLPEVKITIPEQKTGEPNAPAVAPNLEVKTFKPTATASPRKVYFLIIIFKAPLPKKRYIDPEVTRLLSIINDSTDGDEWERVVNEKNITFYKRFVPGNPMLLVKGLAILEGVPLDIMYGAIEDSSLRSGWESLFGSFEIVEKNPERNSEVIYYTLNAPFPVQDRDFLQRRTILHDYPVKGQVIMHFVSIDHPKKPLLDKYIRAHTHIAGYLFKQLSSFPLRCAIYIVSQVDVKGLIPKSIVNWCAARSCRQWVDAYEAGCRLMLKERNEKKKTNK